MSQVCQRDGCEKSLHRKTQKYCSNACRMKARRDAGLTTDPRKGVANRYAKKGSAPAPSRPGLHGGTLQPGMSHNGGPGRPRNALRLALRDVLGMATDEVIKRFGDADRLAIMDVDDLRKLIEAAARYGLGQPQQQLKHTGTGANGAISIAVIGPRPKAE